MSNKGDSAGSIGQMLSSFAHAYSTTTPARIKLVDAFILYAFLTGIVQIVYMLLVGTFPFNSFLAGLLSCVGVFVFTVSLRLQLTSDDFKSTSIQRSFADYCACCLILFLAAANFMG